MIGSLLGIAELKFDLCLVLKFCLRDVSNGTHNSIFTRLKSLIFSKSKKGQRHPKEHKKLKSPRDPENQTKK